MIINNINDFADYIGIEVSRLKKAIYKYYDFGPWITWTESGITIGSIVEGSDAEFLRTIDFPFDSSLYEDWMSELDVLTDETWHEANDE